MSRLLAVFLSLTAASARADYTTAPVTAPGEISGTVKLTGPRPAPATVARDRNPEVCGASGPDESLIVAANGGVKNAIVYLKDITAGRSLEPGTASLDQKGCAYVPHVLAVPVGTTVNLLNGDAVLHNIHAEGSTSFNYAMPMTVKRIPKKLTRPGFLRVKCDVHPWMSGVLAVMSNPYFAVTGDDGSFEISGIPPGTYTLGVWHETLNEHSQQVTVPPNGKVSVPVALTR